MSEQPLSISFSNAADTVEDPYWLNMEIVKEDEEDGMTTGEAASLIDSLYDIKICGESPDPYNVEETQEVNNDPTVEEFADILSKLDIFTPCSTHKDGSYDVDIKVFRSHPSTEIYKLRVSNGTASTPIKKEERVIHTVEVEEATSYTFDNPVMGNPVIVWSGIDGPDLHLRGNTVWWEGEMTGSIRAEFDTEYDLVSIHVTGELTLNSEIVEGTLPSWYKGVGWYSGSEDASEIVDTQDIQCSVLAFYHFQFSELILNKPEEDSTVDGVTKDNLCSFLSGGSLEYNDGSMKVDDTPGEDPEPENYDDDCYADCAADCANIKKYCNKSDAECTQDYNDCIAECKRRCTRWCTETQEHTEICDCSHEETKWETERRIECPSDAYTGKELKAEPYVKYVRCNDTDEEVNDPAFYEETCCESWPFDHDMPRCETIYSEYRGDGEFDESKKQEYKDRYASVSFVGVGPEEGICGERIVEQIVNAKNCCVEAPEIYIHPENNASVIADNSAVLLIASGGTLPITWTVSGDEVYFKDGGVEVNRIITDSRSVLLYADDACGSITIDISDICNKTAEYDMRASGGSWVSVWYRHFQHITAPDPIDPALKKCTYSGDELSDPGGDNSELEYSVITDAPNNAKWETRTFTGKYRFTETGDVFSTVDVDYDLSSTNCETHANNTTRVDQDDAPTHNVWPNCADMPFGLRDVTCSSYGDYIGWYCHSCCAQVDDTLVLYKDRYGVTTCGTRDRWKGYQVNSRRWEVWDC